MADNHEQFIEFNKTIKLSETKKTELEKNRDELRKKIKKYFKEEKSDETSPKFNEQGSFQMGTTVNPIYYEETDDKGNTKKLYPYDLDDGVYFIDKIENRKGVETYHKWINDAVKDHTSKGTIKKNTCVRVLYADGHHIDLPIYFKEIEENKNKTIPELAHKSERFIKSDPKEFYEWFNDKANPQLRRIVRYLKAWKDKQDNTYSTRMPSGLVLTILATNSYLDDNLENDRDDTCLKGIINSIKNILDLKFECFRPTIKKNEDLLSKYNENHFKDRLSKFLDSANEAINHSDKKEACKKWQKHLGDRFPCSSIPDQTSNKSKSYSEPAVVNVNAGSA